MCKEFSVKTMKNAVHSDATGICLSTEMLQWPEGFVISLQSK